MGWGQEMAAQLDAVSHVLHMRPGGTQPDMQPHTRPQLLIPRSNTTSTREATREEQPWGPPSTAGGVADVAGKVGSIGTAGPAHDHPLARVGVAGHLGKGVAC